MVSLERRYDSLLHTIIADEYANIEDIEIETARGISTFIDPMTTFGHVLNIIPLYGYYFSTSTKDGDNIIVKFNSRMELMR